MTTYQSNKCHDLLSIFYIADQKNPDPIVVTESGHDWKPDQVKDEPCDPVPNGSASHDSAPHDSAPHDSAPNASNYNLCYFLYQFTAQ